ncbi:hypothetical protein T265_11141 [Opisthorchis viverrini]|uniref:PH domain-containing protein n=1 Tax=Opisthorchis viverrini TaxID=6198 RepID=A0A074ZAN0_OPIVI|nr:hypothetical protein T265_11141 [Opisthorchis viverrini]KER20280.1 hypothetical protein T265_11141 [Opisthorchis viverrini]
MQKSIRANEHQLLYLANKAREHPLGTLTGNLWKKSLDTGKWQLRYFILYQNLLFYYDCERAERPSGVAFLESSYCEPIVNLRSSRDERLGGQQGVSCASGVQLFPHQCLKFNKEVIGCQTTRFRQQETIIMPSYHANRRKHEGWDTARLPVPRQENLRRRGRVRTTDLPVSELINTKCVDETEFDILIEDSCVCDIRYRTKLCCIGERWLKWLEREFTDRKVRGLNLTSAPRLPLSRLGV